jgi:hypothetical protein
MLATTRNQNLLKPMIGVSLDGVENSHRLNRYFSACSIAGQNCDTVVAHIPAISRTYMNARPQHPRISGGVIVHWSVSFGDASAQYYNTPIEVYLCFRTVSLSSATTTYYHG